ncbi:MAG: hypothetical protein AAF430_22935 [Myxococcota bacterium]
MSARVDFGRGAPLLGLGIRPGLLEVWDGALEAPLTLVTAPGGSGKTTLLRAWRARLGAAPSVWLELDELHANPALFVEDLIPAIRESLGPAGVDPPFGTWLLKAIPHLERHAPAEIWRYLRDDVARLPEPVTLFLDNYHLIGRDSGTDRLVGTLLRESPRQLRFVVATRGAPPLVSARLSASDGLVEVGPGDLELRGDQVRAVLDATGVAATPDDADRLLTQTRGWVTGVVLAARALAQLEAHERPDFVDNLARQGSLFDFVAGELLSGEGPEAVAVAETAAILGAVPRERLADALPEEVPASGIQTAIDRGLLLHEGGRVFVHQLWRELLLSRVREQQGRAAWLARNARLARLLDAADPSRAAALYVESESWEALADVLEREGREWLNHGRDSWVEEFLPRVPERLRQGRPGLDYLAALQLRRVDMDAALDALMEVADRFRAARDRVREISALTDAGVIAANRNRMDRMRVIAKRAMSLRSLATEPRVRTMGFVGVAVSALLAGRVGIADTILRRLDPRASAVRVLRLVLLRLQGRWDESLELIEKALRDTEGDENPTYFVLEMERAFILGMRSAGAKAHAAVATRARDAFADFRLTFDEARAGEILGHLLRQGGDVDGARREFERSGRLTSTTRQRDHVAHMQALCARELWLAGQPALAAETARSSLGLFLKMNETRHRSLHYFRAALAARVLAECGAAKEALQAVRTLGRRVEAPDLPLSGWGSGVQCARVADLASDSRSCMRWLTKASKLAASAQLRDLAPEVEPQLLEWAANRAQQFDIGWVAPQALSPAGHPALGWSIRSFGGIEVSRSGTVLPDAAWRGATAKRLLLRVLCAGPRGVRREQLQVELWPDRSSRQAGNSLRVALSRLRSALRGLGEDPLTLEGDRVGVSTAFRDAWDVARLERAIASEVDTEALLALYRGPFAPEVYDDWAESERAHLEDKIAAAALRAVDATEKSESRAGAASMAAAFLDRRPNDAALWSRLSALRTDLDDPAGAARARAQAAALSEGSAVR